MEITVHAGSSPAGHTNTRVAQLVEHRSYTSECGGSNPPSRTKSSLQKEIANMSKLAHTPGPWAVGYWGGRCHKAHGGGIHPGLKGDDPCVYDPIFYKGHSGIAGPEVDQMVVTTEYDELKISEADAHLIAAAPMMFEALEATLSWLTSYPGGGAMKCYEQARAALAAAKGEGK